MWDDPEWMFGHLDRFLENRYPRSNDEDEIRLLGLPTAWLGNLCRDRPVLGLARRLAGRPAVVVGYLLFFGYSIGFTHLLRREIRRRQWLNGSPGLLWRMAAAVVAIGMAQTFLIYAVTLAMTGTVAQMSGTTILFSTWMGVTAADGAWVAIYVGVAGPRRFRKQEMRLELALREAELRALESAAESALPVQQPELHPGAGGGESAVGAGYAHAVGEHPAL